jgi:hypothetical protein
MYSLCSSISSVAYPSDLLPAFVSTIFYHAESPTRIRASLRLVNTSLQRVRSAPPEVVSGVIQCISKRQEQTSLLELSLAIRVLAEVCPLADLIRPYLNILLQEWRDASLVFGNLQVAHLRFFNGEPSDEESVLRASLKSKRPSRFSSGLRQLYMAQYRMKDVGSIRYMRSASAVLVPRFRRFLHVSWAVGWKVHLITNWLSNPLYTSMHREIVQGLQSMLLVPTSAPWFCDCAFWVASAIRAGYGGFASSIKWFTHADSPSLFKFAMGVLREQLRLVAPGMREAFTMECFLAFIGGHTDRQSCYTVYYLRSFVEVLYGMQRDAVFLFCLNAVKLVRFLPAFLAVADAVKRIGDSEFAAVVAETLAPLVTPEEQKRALAALPNGKLTREAIDLAAVEGNVIPMR